MVSPQRLIHHKDNWYLDAWDPEQSALRRFALDRIQKPELSTEAAIDIPSAQLDPTRKPATASSPAPSPPPPPALGIASGVRRRRMLRIHSAPIHPLHSPRRPLDRRRTLAPRPTPTPATRRHPGTHLALRQPARTADGRATLRRRRRSHRTRRTARADARNAGGGVGEVCSGVGRSCFTVGAGSPRDALSHPTTAQPRSNCKSALTARLARIC